MEMSREAYKQIKEELIWKEVPFKETACAFVVSDLIKLASKSDQKLLEREIRKNLWQSGIKTEGLFSLRKCQFRRNNSDWGIYTIPNITVYDVGVQYCYFMLPDKRAIRIDPGYGVTYKKMPSLDESFTCTHAYNNDIEVEFWERGGRRLEAKYGKDKLSYGDNEISYFKGEDGNIRLQIHHLKPAIHLSLDEQDGEITGYVSFALTNEDNSEKIYVQSGKVVMLKLNGQPRSADEIKDFYDWLQKAMDILRNKYGSSYWFTIVERFTDLCFEALASEDKMFDQDKMVLPEIDLLEKDIRDKVQSARDDIKISYFKDKLDYLDNKLQKKDKDVVFNLQ